MAGASVDGVSPMEREQAPNLTREAFEEIVQSMADSLGKPVVGEPIEGEAFEKRPGGEADG